ncbi:hypothetical protein SAMN04487944_101411 [Gracilibacillus ureilyticus]|uniref:Short-chain dehydrogenase n=1 Tax=Gracilibacillus ureilyticus TaxID=531814 RepID=A0A1H9LUN8_9BACI|nr:SDR family oxidoreductase [Gracilibacillus ureilyticus]SER15140.1 hypothetical protein SAMN04487944_101411 [Gracilibacillus ureilyticus]
MNSLKGKVALITGASSGIGKEITLQLASRGVTPVMIARSEEVMQSLQQEINKNYNMNSYYYSVDLTDEKEWERTINEIQITLPAIDIIINNAGFGIFELFDQMNWEKAEQMLLLNTHSLMYTTYRFLPLLKRKSQAHIINIASQAGRISTPKAAVYSASKAAVISFTNALRMELAATDVKVTSVNLGPVKTSFFDQADPSGKYLSSVGRYMLDPGDVASRICRIIFTKKREINLPYWMHIGSKLYQLSPNLMEKVLRKQFERK